MNRHIAFGLALLLGTPGVATTLGVAAETSPENARIQFVCPGLKLSVRPEDPSGPGIVDFRCPELVLVVQRTAETEPGARQPPERIDRTPECTVKRVLYGSYAGKTIRFEWPLERTFWYWGEGEFIVALIPAFYKEEPEYTAFYGVPAADERAEAALCQARLDYAALASDGIFVGRELSIGGPNGPDADDSWNQSNVEVIRVLHGPALQPGTAVQIIDGGLVHTSNYHRRPRPEPRIYFVVRRDRPGKPEEAYHIATHQPVDQEAKVVEALTHGSQCVAYERKEGDETITYREVVFPGTNAEAIELLGADNDAAVSLFYRTLMHRRQAARPLVVAAIENEMSQMEPPADKHAGFRRLKRLVDLLGDMEREDGAGDIEKLVETYFSRLEKGVPELPEPKGADDSEREYRSTDMNHAFAWLLRELGEDRSREKFGERLLALRAKTEGRWKTEVQVALDAIKMEDSQELADALVRMKDIRPVRSRTGLRHKESGRINLVLFSHDGRLLATAGHEGEIRLWNTADRSVAAVIVQEGSIASIRFSPDDRVLYVAGGGAGLEVHARFDTATGKRDKAYQGHHKGIGSMELSPDGKTMVTSSFYERIMYFWDTESGRILRTISVSLHGSSFFLTPDGKGVLRPIFTSEGPNAELQEWFFEPFRGESSRRVSLPEGVKPWTWASPDGSLVYCANSVEAARDSRSEGRTRVVWGQWKNDTFQKLGEKDVPVSLLSGIAISSDGKFMAVARSLDAVSFLSLPELAVVGQVAYPRHDRFGSRIESLVFSPDSKLLALGMERQTPGLIHTDTFKRLLPFDGHAGKTMKVFFTADGAQLRSYGSDNTVCTWDETTMKMLRRAELPAGYTWANIRELDGRYAICFSAPTEEEPFGRSGDVANPAQIYDANIGQFIAKVPVDNDFLYWVDDNQAVMVNTSLEEVSTLCRFNYHTGDVLSTVEIAKNWPGRGEVTEDGQSVFILPMGYEGRATAAAPVMVELATGKITRPERENADRVRVNSGGLVPGGKYFYLADPNVYIYDRQTLKQVSKKVLDGVDILSLAFSSDGRRYALVSGGRIFIEDVLKWYDPKTQSIVRIHDTETGKTLLAFPASTRWVEVKFSPDGRRLAVINDDGTIEVWPLPLVP